MIKLAQLQLYRPQIPRKADILELISGLRRLQRELGWLSLLSTHTCPAAGLADVLDVPVICSTAAAEDRDLRMSVQEVAVLIGQLDRISGIEIRRVVELLMAASRCIGAQTADSPRPFFVC